MGRRKKEVYIPDEGIPIAFGMPTVTVAEDGHERVHYLTPHDREEKRATNHASQQPPLPSIDSALLAATEEGPVDQATSSTHDAQAKGKSNSTPPHIIMTNFINKWAQPLLNIFRARETDPHLGKPCYECKGSDAKYRCEDCLNAPLLCQKCIVDAHKWNPLHRIQHWTGQYFERLSLHDLGFIFHLGHHGRPCMRTRESDKGNKLTVVHTTGIQTLNVRYCECLREEEGKVQDRPLQLWEAGLWPATYVRTQTVFTHQVLRQFHHLTLQAKTSAHDFYATLRRMTKNAFFYDVKDRYREFMTAHREFSYIQALKRFGQDVAKKLQPGCLAVLCPACPHPDINMDPQWQDRPREEWYKDAFHYAKDGNFNINQHDKKMDHLDFPLTDGAAYYADNDEYTNYLDKMNVYPEMQEETSTCSNFHALSDRYAGKIKSGQIGLCCTRHGFVLPCGTVDLEKGERYANVDFATISGTRWWMKLKLMVGSYDVHCKFAVHWGDRLKKIAASIPGVSLLWPLVLRCVPKFHLPAHTGLCRYLHSFYYMPWVGMTDGEAPERRWSIINAIGRSVREMGPGHRQDIINEHNSDYNIQKLFKMSKYLEKKLKEALKYSVKNATELEELEGTLEANGMPLKEWKKQEREFIAEMTDPDVKRKTIKNPYQPIQDKSPTTQDVLASLNKGEAERRGKRKAAEVQDAGVGGAETGGLGPMLLAAIDMERRQTHLLALVEADKMSPSSARFNEIEEQRRQLEERMDDWLLWHTRIMGPTVALLKEEWPDIEWPSQDGSEAECVVLPLPSSYPLQVRVHPVFEPFTIAERALREAQASDALRDIRTKLGLQSYLNIKTSGLFGQAAKTRKGKAVQATFDKVRDLRLEYEFARKKIEHLLAPGQSSPYQPLTDRDCRPLEIFHDEQPGQKKKEVAWIWRDGMYHGGALDKWTHEATRIEWFRASARCARWKEEVGIVEEEMCRTQRYFDHFMRWWQKQAVSTVDMTLTARGAAAFAARQSAMYSRLLAEARKCFPQRLHVSVKGDVAAMHVEEIDVA